MNVVKKSKELHSLSFKKGNDYYACLNEALKMLEAEYNSGNNQDLIVNNYAAVLLDLQKNDAALSLLLKHSPNLKESHENLAIAYAKTNLDIEKIREWNSKSKMKKSCEDAIVAYIDWQAM